MRLSDHLNAFSVEDLRELAKRRQARLSQEALSSRQTLVRSLASVLGHYESVYATVTQLNQAELGLLRCLLQPGHSGSLSGISAALGTDPAGVKAALESLRLWGLVFPEGNWERIAVPASTQLAEHYLRPHGPRRAQEPVHLSPPVLVEAKTPCHPRLGSLERDVAELLARVARARLRVTQADRMNRRDLRAMEGYFAVSTSGYGEFLSYIASALDCLQRTPEGILAVDETAESWLGAEQPARAVIAAEAWQAMRGYPECVEGDPAESEFLPMLLPRQRAAFLHLIRTLAPDRAVTVASVAERLQWDVPWSFQQWDATRDAARVAARLTRSLYWLGLLAVDVPETPAHAALTPLGAHVLLASPPGHAVLVPEEHRFFLQPNAEVFAPPNLSPRALLHLRRITGERKGGPEGMYPLTADSVRRALDSGLTVAGILAFLEAFSRTGVPSSVRALVETAGRQHGRIRLVPAGFVLVTDDPRLMEELRHVKQVERLLGDPLTERSAIVPDSIVPELMRTLRARGYAPLNVAEVGEPLPLAEDPDRAPAPLDVGSPEPPADEAADLDWATLGNGRQESAPAAQPAATLHTEIRDLLRRARDQGLEVEIEYQPPSGQRASGAASAIRLWPYHVGRQILQGYCLETADLREYDLPDILSARLTGEMAGSERL